MKKILFLLISINAAFAQTVELTPSGSTLMSSTKIGTNTIAINSLRNNNIISVSPGFSKLILSGDYYSLTSGGGISSSEEAIEFNNLSTNRWTLRDYKYQFSVSPNGNVDAFQILNHNGFNHSTAFHINKANNFIGLNTDKPLTALHLAAGSSNVSPFANTTFFIENNNHNYLHMGADDGFDNGILFSNTNHNPSFGGSIQYKADNRMVFQTNGQSRLLLNASGRVGINTTSPDARLHVFHGSSGVTGTPADEVIVENSGNNYIQMLNPQANEAGLLFGLPTNVASGGIVYNSSSSGALDFRTNNNVTQMRIDHTGKVGLGILTPAATLDVNGSTKIGSNGTVLNHIIKLTVNKNIPSIAAADQQLVTFSVSNAALNSSVYVSPATALPAGVIIAHARVSVAGTVEVAFYNAKTTAIDPAAMDFCITVVN